jgi:hypothetical protein
MIQIFPISLLLAHAVEAGRSTRRFTSSRVTLSWIVLFLLVFWIRCDPSEFYDERFTLRQRLFAKPRHTELFIVVTMYNEEDELFARTMSGVIKNIEYMNSRTKSSTWGGEAWKKIVVCVVSDGRAKINPRTRAVLAGMGVYQDGIAKQRVNGKNVTAHVYEVSQHGKPIICSATCLPSAVSTPRT